MQQTTEAEMSSVADNVISAQRTQTGMQQTAQAEMSCL